jgi:hypothetical protein
MEQQTKELIEKLKSIESKEVVESTVLKEVDRCKKSLQNKNYKFDPDGFPDELSPGQAVLNKDVVETRYMEELAHIKRGITDEWVHHVDDAVRFNDIRDAVIDVLFNLEL